jgi:tetratricopeptide (TPR) repeat protein
LRVVDGHGQQIIAYAPQPAIQAEVPPPATEPPAPEAIASADELYVTGLHLEQYRHATRCPTRYWREAVRRDPLDARCNNALGLWHLKHGEFAQAEAHFRKAIERLTRRNANPYDGEPCYNLGLCLRYLGRDDEAYAAFYKACWNQAWMAAGYHGLAEIDCTRQDWRTALEHLERSLLFNVENTRARNLKVLVLRRMQREGEAKAVLCETRALDPLDWWARHLNGKPLDCDLQVALDLAHDCAKAGFFAEALQLLESPPTPVPGDLPDQNWGALPLVHYTRGWLEQKRGNAKNGLRWFKRAATTPTVYCFPARLEEIAILEAAMRANPVDARAPYYLGNLLYDRRRHVEAIRLWERSARLDPHFPIVWRNLGLGYFNIQRQPARARAAYERAFRVNPSDARLAYERDQLWKRLRVKPEERLRELESHLDLVEQRDDLSVELCALYNQIGRHQEALELVSSRHFQPWEGGEGGPLGQHVRSHLALGRVALSRGDAEAARQHFEAALKAPPNLGEARHLLANQSDIHYWLGCALAASGEESSARRHWRAAATFRGDFQEMSVRAFSAMTYYSALSWGRLGQKAKARKLLRDLRAYARQLRKAPANIDYFATSLPTMLLFDDDLGHRQETTVLFLEAQALLGLGRLRQAKQRLQEVLRREPSHALAVDLTAGLPKRRDKE